MYRPHGRYRYTYGAVRLSEIDRTFCPSRCVQNWRAAVAMVVPVSLTLPGLFNNINPDIHVGVVTRRLFDISYMLGVSVVLNF